MAQYTVNIEVAGVWLRHEREHAAEIRAGLGLPWPRRLLHL